MTQDTIRNLTDAKLQQAKAWIAQEEKDRTQRRKRETIAKIRELAQNAGVTVIFEEVRGETKSSETSIHKPSSS
jgi:plasmid stabilization system protein ParE